MANIRRRVSSQGQVSWQVSIRKDGHRVYRSFQRKKDAESFARKTEHHIEEGRYRPVVEARRHTLAEAIDRYRKVVMPRKKASTQRTDNNRLDWWRHHHGEVTLDKINLPWALAIRDGMTSSATNRNRYLEILRHLLKIAADEWHWLRENPLGKLKALKEPRGRVRFLSIEEKNRLLMACRESEQPLLYPIVVFALETGARKGEILGLRRRDVDFKRRRVVFNQTKNEDRRALPLEGEAYQLIVGLLRNPRFDTGLVFPGQLGTIIDIKKAWNTAIKRANIENFRFHDLRHTFASYLAMSGATLAEIAEALGHRTLQMVRRYAHLSELHTATVVARMREKFLSQSSKRFPERIE